MHYVTLVNQKEYGVGERNLPVNDDGKALLDLVRALNLMSQLAQSSSLSRRMDRKRINFRHGYFLRSFILTKGIVNSMYRVLMGVIKYLPMVKGHLN